MTAPLDSESWTCRSCGAAHIGKRPGDGTCAQCVVTQVTTEPAQPAWTDVAAGIDRLAIPANRIDLGDDPDGDNTPDEPCDYHCGYYSHGKDLIDHMRYEHARCPLCGREPLHGDESVSHKADCPRLAPGHAYESESSPVTAAGRPDWLPTEAELAEARADAMARRMACIRALTHEQCRTALRYLSGYEPEGFDRALDAVAKWDETEARAREGGGSDG